MRNRSAILLLAAALVLAVCGTAYAGAAGGSDNTTTYTTSTSTSTSTSQSHSNVNVGNVWLGYTGTDRVYNNDHPNATLTMTYSDLASYPSTLELLSQGPSTYTGSIYWSNPAWGQSGSADINATRTFYDYSRGYGYGGVNQAITTTYGWVARADPGILYTTINGRGTVDSTSGGIVGTTYTALKASDTSTVVSTNTTQQVTKTVTVIKVGHYVLGTNTNINTNTNTDTNYDNHTTNYEGQGATDEYEVNATVSVSPIVLDLSSTGKFEASGGEWRPHRGLRGNRLAMFDLRGNGMQMLTEWIGPHQGLLVAPKADGTVDGDCLFGTAGGFDNGFEKLSVRDVNHDGVLTGRELKGLAVWVDSNGDARIEPGELHSLASLGITRINLAHRDYRGTFVMRGKVEKMWDWWPTALDVRHVAHASGAAAR